MTSLSSCSCSVRLVERHEPSHPWVNGDPDLVACYPVIFKKFVGLPSPNTCFISYSPSETLLPNTLYFKFHYRLRTDTQKPDLIICLCRSCSCVDGNAVLTVLRLDNYQNNSHLLHSLRAFLALLDRKTHTMSDDNSQGQATALRILSLGRGFVMAANA